MVRHIRTHRSESVHRLELDWCILLWREHPTVFRRNQSRSLSFRFPLLTFSPFLFKRREPCGSPALFFCSFSLQAGMSTQRSAIWCCRILDVDVSVIVAVVVDNAARSLGAQHSRDEEGALPSKLESAEFQTLVKHKRALFVYFEYQF